jgi:lysophospholipase L1-like esterase
MFHIKRTSVVLITVISLGLCLSTPKEGQAQTVKIMPWGDSITRGSEEGDWCNSNKSGYRYLLAQLLKTRGYNVEFVGDFQTNAPDWNWPDLNLYSRHQGVHGLYLDELMNGTRINSDGVARHCKDKVVGTIEEELNEHNPDIVLLHVGTNDLNLETTTAQGLYDKIVLTLNRIQGFRPSTTIFLAKIIGRGQPYEGWETRNARHAKTQQINNLLGNINRNGVILVDQFNALTYPTEDNPNSDMSDEWHPNGTGYEKMACTWFRALLNILPKLITQQPGDVAVGENMTATFSVNPGTNRTYQWFTEIRSLWNADPLRLFEIPSGTNPSFTTPPVEKAGNGSTFWCRVRDQWGGEEWSRYALLTVTADGNRNLVKNQGFEHSYAMTPSHWHVCSGGNNDATLVNPSAPDTIGWSAMKISVKGSHPSSLYQNDLMLHPGTTYSLRFKSKSASANSIAVWLQRMGGPVDDCVIDVNAKRENITTDWATHTVLLTTRGAAECQCEVSYRLLFGFDHTSDYFIDDIIMVPYVEDVTPAYSEPVFKATPTYSKPDFLSAPGNIVPNPGFESGTAPWLFYTNGAGSFAREDLDAGSGHAAHISIVRKGTNVQLYQPGLKLQPFTRYRLSFTARSNRVQEFFVSLHKHGAPYNSYGFGDAPFRLEGDWVRYSFSFVTSGFSGTATDGRLRFAFDPNNAAGDEYWIDDVVMERYSGSDTVENGGFYPFCQPWYFYTNGSGAFDCTELEAGSRVARARIYKPGSNVQLFQSGIRLEPNTKYRLSFTAMSQSGNDMSVWIHRHDAPYTNYGLGDFLVELTPDLRSYSTEFTTTGFTSSVDDARIRFWFAPFASAGDTYCIDNVVLQKADAAP